MTSFLSFCLLQKVRLHRSFEMKTRKEKMFRTFGDRCPTRVLLLVEIGHWEKSLAIKMAFYNRQQQRTVSLKNKTNLATIWIDKLCIRWISVNHIQGGEDRLLPLDEIRFSFSCFIQVTTSQAVSFWLVHECHAWFVTAPWNRDWTKKKKSVKL